MINANEFRKNNEELFNETFDFESFDAYINEFFKDSKHNFLQIGIDCDWQTEKWAKENGKKCETLSFRKGQSNYIWHSNIQVAQSVDRFVIKYLEKNGFHTNQKGACGYDHYDIIVVSI